MSWFDWKLKDLTLDWKIVFTIVATTMLLVVDHYQAIFPEKWMDHFFLYLVVPLFCVKYILQVPLSKLGVQRGDWKAGLLLTVGGWVLLAAVMVFIAPTADFRAYYSGNQSSLPELIFMNFADLVGWEFIFRGWLLFMLLPVCGPYAIILQAVPFTIAHFGKPELETLSCIFGGPAYGYIAWRTRSFYYPFLIHLFLTTITILIARLTA